MQHQQVVASWSVWTAGVLVIPADREEMEKSWSRQQLEAEMKESPRRRRNKPTGEFPGIPIGSEDEIQAYFFKWINLHKGRFPILARFFAIPNGSHTTRTVRGILKMTGRISGPPDTCLPVPNDEFYGLYIEFKSESGTLSIEQRDYCKFLRDVGYRVEVFRTWTDAANVTIEYLRLPIQKL
ncbi:MAG: VRR-NUC domain-containing protein [Pyrinomonadaceae bacterium]